MSASLWLAFLWAASAGVYLGALFLLTRRAIPVGCRPQPYATIAAVLFFAGNRMYPEIAALPPLIFVCVFVAAIGAFRSFRPGQRNDGLYALLYVEALAPMLIVVIADYFEAARAFSEVARWMCAAPAPSTLLYLTVTRKQSVP